MTVRVLRHNVLLYDESLIMQPCADPNLWVSPEIPYSAKGLQNMVNAGIIPSGEASLPWATRFRREVLGQLSLFTPEQALKVVPIKIEDLKKEGYL